MKLSCENCGVCCSDMQMYGTIEDIAQFEAVGNHPIYHSSLQELRDSKQSPGFHVHVLPNGREARMQLSGPCKALNLITKQCNAHQTDTSTNLEEPEICRNLALNGTGCAIALMHAGLL